MTAEVLAPEKGATAVATRTASAVQTVAPAPEVAQPLSDFDKIIALAQNPELPIERIGAIIDLHQKLKKDDAERQFNVAMAKAKAEFPTILKDKHVKFVSKGGDTEYDHETLAGIAKTVDPILGKYGLYYRWKVSSKLSEPVRVTCIVTHEAGHSEDTTLESGRDDSGGKNAIQGVGSSLTYLQRYTLRGALGLSVGEDDNGKKAGQKAGANNEFVSAEQADEILGLIAKAGITVAEVCHFHNVESVADFRLKDYNESKVMLTKRIAKRAQGGAA